MCIATAPQPAAAATARARGSQKPSMLFHAAAPTASAACATSILRASIDTAAPAPASASITGKTRRFSASASTCAAPGRVDSPPTSTMSAPSSSIRRPRAIAFFGSRKSPPSENESGVTLTTPITIERDKSNEKRPARNTRGADAGAALNAAKNARWRESTAARPGAQPESNALRAKSNR